VVNFNIAVAGAGGVTQAGSGTGTVVFANINTYTGPTVINAGSFLQIGNGSANGTIDKTSSITGDGTLAFAPRGLVTPLVPIGGNLSLDVFVTLGGTLVLAQANTFTGSTTLESGGLQIGDGGTNGSLLGTSVITGGASGTGTLILNRADVVTFPTPIQGNLTLVHNGTGTTTLTSASNTYSGQTIVNAGILSVTSSPTTTSGISIQSGGTFKLSGAGTVLTVPVTIAAGGTLDLTSNDLVVASTDPADKATKLAALVSQLATGSNGGTWTGTGITSSTVAADPTHKVVVVLDNALLGLTMVNGASVDSSSLVVEATYYGDSNLDRKVDVTDLGILATNYGKTVTNGFLQGDFNGDGKVDVTDLGILATDYGLGTSGAFTIQAGSVPEPATLGILTIAGVSHFFGRRRKERREA
jgi:autotransporter-associated beta strand protein